MMKKLPIALLLICCTVLGSQPAWAAGDINYDNIKLLYVGPFVSFDAKLGHRVVKTSLDISFRSCPSGP